MQRINIILFVFALFCIVLSPLFGQSELKLINILNVSSLDYELFWNLRLPRAILAFLVGAILALSGLVLQNIFRNSLVEPYTLGISSGAVLGAAIAILLNINAQLFGFSLTTLFAFVGAELSAIFLIFASLYMRGFSHDKLLLLGIGLSSFYGGVLFLAYNFSDVMQTYSIIRFTIGSLGVSGYSDVLVVGITATILLIVVLYCIPELRLFAESMESAMLKGVNLKFFSILLLSFISLSVGASVSVAGPIGFIGLIAPQILKWIFKKPLSELAVTSFLFGGIFLLICDDIAKSLPSELPVGVITAIIGGPFFVMLVLRTKN